MYVNTNRSIYLSGATSNRASKASLNGDRTESHCPWDVVEADSTPSAQQLAEIDPVARS